ncbi:MAG: hypothetical protein IPH28_25235 [Cytophagaceae bacterium]|nr:hypothetical protein [Cytophagaceae bacterium]
MRRRFINYLSIKGISERLEAKGYGETRVNYSECQRYEEEHQVNRRTEFKVLEFIKATESE